jgi:hypothetical protein
LPTGHQVKAACFAIMIMYFWKKVDYPLQAEGYPNSTFYKIYILIDE